MLYYSRDVTTFIKDDFSVYVNQQLKQFLVFKCEMVITVENHKHHELFDIDSSLFDFLHVI